MIMPESQAVKGHTHIKLRCLAKRRIQREEAKL